jgi:hypothetical protein
VVLSAAHREDARDVTRTDARCRPGTACRNTNERIAGTGTCTSEIITGTGGEKK